MTQRCVFAWLFMLSVLCYLNKQAQSTKNESLCHERFAPGISFTFATPRDDPHALFANSHLWYNKGYNKPGRAGRAAPMEVS